MDPTPAHANLPGLALLGSMRDQLEDLQNLRTNTRENVDALQNTQLGDPVGLKPPGPTRTSCSATPTPEQLRYKPPPPGFPRALGHPGGHAGPGGFPLGPDGVPMKAAPSRPMKAAPSLPGSSSKQPDGHDGGPGEGVTMTAAPSPAGSSSQQPACSPGVPGGPGGPAGQPAQLGDLKTSMAATAKAAGVPSLFQTPLPPGPVWVVDGAGVAKLGEAVQDLMVKHTEFAEWQLNNLLTAEREINFLRDRVVAVEAALQQAVGSVQAQAATIESLQMRIAGLRDAGHSSKDDDEPVILFRKAGN